jgi:hypothetical protein
VARATQAASGGSPTRRPMARANVGRRGSGMAKAALGGTGSPPPQCQWRSDFDHRALARAGRPTRR